MNIAKLVGFYYRTLVDHHKDRDCHFYINKRWSYGREPVIYVEHNGYIHEIESQEFATEREAEDFLSAWLIEKIRAEIKHWRTATADPEEKNMWGYTQQEIDSNRADMDKLEADLNEFLRPPTRHE